MPDTKVCMGIMPNPDVSGLGVSVMLLYALSLVLTAIIQTAQGQLTLYHAVLIYHLLMSFSFTLIPTISDFSAGGSLRLHIFTVSSFLSHLAWSLYVWSTALTFGSQPECNHSTKYIIMWVTVRATATWVRICWISGTAIALAYVILMLVFEFANPCLSGRTISVRSDIWEEDSDDGDIGELAWFDVAVRLTHFIYGIKRNNVLPGESVWSFGQVLSLVLLLGFCNDAIKWYKDRREYPVSPPATTLNPAAATTTTTPNPIATTANTSISGSASRNASSEGTPRPRDPDNPPTPVTTVVPITSGSAAANVASGGATAATTTVSKSPAFPAATVEPSTLGPTSTTDAQGSDRKLPLKSNVLDVPVEPSGSSGPTCSSGKVENGFVDLELGLVGRSLPTDPR
ncbi:hypothetical protein BD410DRAFT_845486 [Rickenella mellea]|uniref:Uncharacterized protein n=1 Tax=Rickenella mellea TaxID=50990 RepID=A0A4Y7PJ13_9AGAM|nr:hypothetical protein BD410DRAFT_845486 [Rickenella mellea]